MKEAAMYLFLMEQNYSQRTSCSSFPLVPHQHLSLSSAKLYLFTKLFFCLFNDWGRVSSLSSHEAQVNVKVELHECNVFFWSRDCRQHICQ